MGLRVATFNIRNGRALDGRHLWWLRRRSTLRAIVDLDADVLGLQEVYGFQRQWLARRLPDHEPFGVGRGRFGGGEQCPVLVRREAATVTGHRVRWFGPDPDRRGQRLEGARFPRIATTCTLEVPDWQESVDVTNVHLDVASADRRRQSVEQLVSWLDPERPQVVLGDFNSEPGDEPLAILSDHGLTSVLPADAGGTMHDFTGRTDGRRIDHIVVSHHLRARGASIAHAPERRPLPSDHWPVVAEIELVPTA